MQTDQRFPEGEVFVVVEPQVVFDPEGLARYQAAAREQATRRGAQVIARGGALYEGDPDLLLHLIQRWPSARAFQEWQESEEYRPLLEERKKYMKVRISIVPAA
ncbi:MAG: DUF1330 domain-containing protein [Sphingobium sp.]|uniref:DUF1330 domain-containing protein n=1 Tax=Sphingobium sp. TaxID=1912891 RepID=UPI0029A9AE6B|nr:DUF1330 domain-containing protein [Sphingobium sp.]MDX3910316.1 DUF1330 domain-containing protein [Sphingobium sp.]